MNTTIGTSQISLANISLGNTNPQSLYFTKFVSAPLFQTDIAANTWTYAFAASSGAPAAEFPVNGTNQPVHVNCYVWRPGTGKIGTILDGNTASTVDEGTATQEIFHIVTFSGAAVSGLQDGDVIVFEVWFRVTQTGGQTYTDTFFYDGITVSTENASATSAASYIETPEDLSFSGALTSVSKSAIIRYSIATRIAKAAIFRYSIAARTALARIYKYSILTHVLKARTFLYRITGVKKYSFSPRSFSRLSFTVPPEVLTRISKPLISRYSIQTRVSLSRLYLYSIIGRIVASKIFRYSILIKLSLIRIYRYSILTKVASLKIIRYGILTKLGIARVYRYSITGLLQAPKLFRYDIVGQVKLVRNFRYNIINSVSNSKNLRYSIQARVSNSKNLRYSIVAKVLNSKILRYAIINKVSLSNIFRYSILSRAALETIYRYSINNLVSLGSIIQYSILQQISQPQIYRYDLEGVENRISKITTLNYNLEARVLNPQILRHSILKRVGADCIQFPTVAGYLNLGNETGLWSQAKTNFSFSLWVKPFALNTGSYQNLVNHGWQNTGSFLLYFINIGTSIVFAIRDSISQKSTTYVLPAGLANTWIHVVCTFDLALPNGEAKMYINGVQLGGVSASITESLGYVGTLLIGSSGASPVGNVKDFRWWTTQTLQQADVNKIYINASNAPTPDYWLKMDETTGNPTDTISAGTKVATLQNTATWTAQAPDQWLGKAQRYLYDIRQMVVKSNLLRYSIRARASLARIYPYSILEKISLLQIYNYAVLARSSLQRIYNYNLQARISNLNIIRYAITNKVSLSQNYLYHILNKVSLSRIYRYAITLPVSISQTFIYEIIGRILQLQTFNYDTIGRISLPRIYNYKISTLPTNVKWLLTGKDTDFPAKIEDMVRDCIMNNWMIQTPGIYPSPIVTTSTTPPQHRTQVDNFGYDLFRSYYIRVKEVQSEVINRQIRLNTSEFQTPVEIECFSRRLRKGESFRELNNMINELLRIFGTHEFPVPELFGIEGVTFERISSMDRERVFSMNVWARRLRIILHYYKVSTIENLEE